MAVTSLDRYIDTVVPVTAVLCDLIQNILKKLNLDQCQGHANNIKCLHSPHTWTRPLCLFID